jgi:hypothetical protein
MGGLDLGAAAAIDQLQAGYRAAGIISLDHAAAEQAVTDQSRTEICHTVALDLELER